MATTRKEIDAADASSFDPSENRTVNIGPNTTETSSGAYVNPDSLHGGEEHTSMPEPVKGK